MSKFLQKNYEIFITCLIGNIYFLLFKGKTFIQYYCQERAQKLYKKWKDQIKKDNNKSTLKNMKGKVSVCF